MRLRKTGIVRRLALAVASASILTIGLSAPSWAEGTHWDYSDPARWGELDPSFSACGEGKSQSPIDIRDAKSAPLGEINFHYSASKVNLLNDGHTIVANYDAGSYIEVGGKRFDLLQFHFHAPSEHRVGGKISKMEIHFVHKSEDGELGVVGVLVSKGAPNNAYDTVIGNLPIHTGDKASVDEIVEAADLMPLEKSYFSYSGSLTTPPCSENVKWMVLTTPVELSVDQLAAYKALHSGNNRPVQPLNGRELLESVSR